MLSNLQNFLTWSTCSQLILTVVFSFPLIFIIIVILLFSLIQILSKFNFKSSSLFADLPDYSPSLPDRPQILGLSPACLLYLFPPSWWLWRLSNKFLSDKSRLDKPSLPIPPLPFSPDSEYSPSILLLNPVLTSYLQYNIIPNNIYLPWVDQLSVHRTQD